MAEDNIIEEILNEIEKQKIKKPETNLPEISKKLEGNAETLAIEIKDRGGRPKGRRSRYDIEKTNTERLYKRMIVRSVRKIAYAQLSLARGCQYLFKLEKEYDEKQKRYVIKPGTKAQVVKDRQEIADYLAGEYDNSEEADYYFITTEKPDIKAIDSALDRVFGKATQNTNVNVRFSMSDLLNELEGKVVENEVEENEDEEKEQLIEGEIMDDGD